MLEKMWEKGILLHSWEECKLVETLLKRIWRFLRKLKIQLLYDPAKPLLGIYLDKFKSGCNKDTGIPMFIAALVTRTKLWRKLT
jgi:hypothetical protein